MAGRRFRGCGKTPPASAGDKLMAEPSPNLGGGSFCRESVRQSAHSLPGCRCLARASPSSSAVAQATEASSRSRCGVCGDLDDPSRPTVASANPETSREMGMHPRLGRYGDLAKPPLAWVRMLANRNRVAGSVLAHRRGYNHVTRRENGRFDQKRTRNCLARERRSIRREPVLRQGYPVKCAGAEDAFTKSYRAFGPPERLSTPLSNP